VGTGKDEYGVEEPLAKRGCRSLWDHGLQIATEDGGRQIHESGKHIHGMLLIHGNGSGKRIHGVLLDLTEGHGVMLKR